MEVDEANETAEGVWYKRGNLSIFIERSRIDRIERERIVEPAGTGEVAASKRRRRERGWTSGSTRIDGLIRQNGARHDVDPYLIFCVMEQESHFNTRALSPMGARGLMQLMPGTAARFGVSNSNDPAQNISGGTRYLKILLKRFNGRVDLVLAGYNAGEGAVMKYGHRVPPYRETRNYVRKITARYRQGE
ncbi:MAG: lytic transglycosylase domain-containing protein [Acidobacteria bacterium]|nr:lytic transglycosylase domain-containing protein [Acidobacteriota bacterium]